MGEVHLFPTEEVREWSAFERFHREVMLGAGTAADATEYALDRFRPFHEQLKSDGLNLTFASECQEPVTLLKAHADRWNAKLAHVALIAFAELFEARR